MKRPPLKDLEAWFDGCVAHLRDSDGFRIPVGRSDEFLLLYGSAARTARYADAYQVLVRADFPTEAIPLARAALELSSGCSSWMVASRGFTSPSDGTRSTTTRPLPTGWTVTN
jgi:hypothetical protein